MCGLVHVSSGRRRADSGDLVVRNLTLQNNATVSTPKDEHLQQHTNATVEEWDYLVADQYTETSHAIIFIYMIV